MRVLDLFSGIGGFSLGLERTGGFETVAFCEIEPFPRRVLAKHWPEVPQYDDVRTLTADVLARDGIAVDVITGGFPCQDISVAGKRAGLGEATRSGLWSEVVRLIGDLRPRYVIVENVANLLSGPSEKRGGWFGRVLGDLAECGYDAEWETYRRQPWALPIAAKEFGLWLTPTVQDGAKATKKWRQNYQNNLTAQVFTPRMWPTPASANSKGAVKARYLGSPEYRGNLDEAVRTSEKDGQMNPPWVEWLMGFPIGHTDLQPLETQSSPKSPNS